ncbi:MAG: hypothetical protein RMJ98_06515 [Myxococcales bacterium]|nr:hypothetical protein [Polyangiaceae bacterium]MDW8248938.1 hypothetical protein [Myxococcales bacterium]
MSALRVFWALWLVGCVHTSDDAPSFPSASREFDIPAPTPSEELPPPAPRLRHTKTLGQVEPIYDRGGALPAAPPGQLGPTVIVNNNVQQNTSVLVTPYGVPGLDLPPVISPSGTTTGRGGGSTGAGRGGAAPGGTPPVGGDWPQVPSYGPR